MWQEVKFKVATSSVKVERSSVGSVLACCKAGQSLNPGRFFPLSKHANEENREDSRRMKTDECLFKNVIMNVSIDKKTNISNESLDVHFQSDSSQLLPQM